MTTTTTRRSARRSSSASKTRTSSCSRAIDCTGRSRGRRGGIRSGGSTTSSSSRRSSASGSRTSCPRIRGSARSRSRMTRRRSCRRSAMSSSTSRIARTSNSEILSGQLRGSSEAAPFILWHQTGQSAESSSRDWEWSPLSATPWTRSGKIYWTVSVESIASPLCKGFHKDGFSHERGHDRGIRAANAHRFAGTPAYRVNRPPGSTA